ncbi:snurportin-1-like isoform X1 [Varroa destructor]|uniref:Snurportin-1 n=2 Tax=Varroa destructor TaxID=109461 RepID=A0A7M7KGT1_VARDE|nr:snurportin-1-like isoform X1 [Varroa destructor]
MLSECCEIFMKIAFATMDEIISGLSSELSITQAPCAATISAERFAQMRKIKTSLPVRQELRRQQFLERQKEKRYDGFLHARGLATGVFGANESLPGNGLKTDKESGVYKSGNVARACIDAGTDEDDTDSEISRPRRPPRSYRNQLMQSEWLVEVPPDLERYLIVLCPKGKRGLLIASRGVTKLYARNGFNFMTFASNLPGGSSNGGRQSNWKPNEFTILDIVYNDASKTCFILDLIYWRSRPYYDSVTAFRFFWLKTQFAECETELTFKERKVKLEVVPFYEWEPQTIQSLLCRDEPPFITPIEVDGILFYHSEGHYIPGICPLVGWLKPYMCVEVLHIEVHPRFFIERPQEYTSLKDKMEQKEKGKKEKARQKKATLPTDVMETFTENQ